MPLHRRFGFDQGFDCFVAEFDQGGRSGWEGVVLDESDRFYSLAESVTDDAIALLDGATGDRQFFWFHYFDPHAPYGDAAGEKPIQLGRILRAIHEGRPGAGNIVERAKTLYDADAAYLDGHLDRLFRYLDEHGGAVETHVVLVADHGESFGEDGSIGHGKRLTSWQIHVPLIIHSPGVAPGTRRMPVASIDVTATLLGLAGADMNPEGGRNLALSPIPERPVFGMRRTFAGPSEDLRTDGIAYPVEGLLFYQAEGEEMIRGNRSSVFDGGGAPIEGARADSIRARFARFEAHLARTTVEEIVDPATIEALEELGYVR